MRARTALFLKGIIYQRSDFFVEKLYGMRASALAVHALAPARGAARDDGWSCSRPLGGSAAKWTNVVWPIKSRQTNQQTNTHYSFIGIDKEIPELFCPRLYNDAVHFFTRPIQVTVFAPYKWWPHWPRPNTSNAYYSTFWFPTIRLISLIILAADCWNMLPIAIQQATSLSSFHAFLYQRF